MGLYLLECSGEGYKTKLLCALCNITGLKGGRE